ncbi:MAG TPA: D-glycero-beta-D-manno-heptose-7-phosphate kinase [Acidobacteriota bacterium]|nr:D-glycero-beta-D-manno-heptose-7-phosphate kinase [Acidobacteriota bacterium]
MNRSTVQQFISRFSSLRILVIGDFMLDHYVTGRVDRISPEAPVPVVDVEGESYRLGGAGNVVMNALALGAKTIPIGVIGNDWAGKMVSDLLGEQNISSGGLIETPRSTTLKTRIVAHQQQVVRVDREQRELVDEATEQKLADNFTHNLDQADAIIVSDYSKGTLTPSLLSKILPAARLKNKLLCLDPKVRHFSSYTPVTIITPNQAEAASVLGYPIVNEDDLKAAAKRIQQMIDCKALLITRGDKGMALFAEGKLTHVHAKAREVYDVTGAGDTVVTSLCLALAAGADVLSAVEIANAAAGVVVGKIGTAWVDPEELLECFS